MHYVVFVGDQERLVEISEIEPDRYQLVLDGQRLEVDARACGPSTWSILCQQRSYVAEMDWRGEQQVAQVAGASVQVEVLDLRRMRLRHAQQASVGIDRPADVLAPMPGKIVAVLVQEGDTVVAGQGLVVVEAMKMENEMRSPKAGVVRALSVAVGAAVESGALLCRID